MPFSEICIYQVKPDKVEEFESIMNEARPFLEERAGLLQLRLMKRGYKIDMEQIREGQPPVELTRIVKCAKYVLFWEFESKEDYGRAQKDLYDPTGSRSISASSNHMTSIWAKRSSSPEKGSNSAVAMEYITATEEQVDDIHRVLQTTIRSIYPKYYPAEVTGFFCDA